MTYLGGRLGLRAAGLIGLSPVGPPGRLVRAATPILSGTPVARFPPARVRYAMDELSHTEPRAVIQAAGQLGKFDARLWISQINLPTAVVVTTKDRVVPVGRQAEWRKP